MKILKFFLFTAAILTFAACSSDDDVTTPVVELTNANLAGTYEIVFYEGSYTTTTEASNGSTVLVESETFTTDTFTNATFTFNEDGTYASSGNYRVTYVLTIAGQAPETEIEIEQFDSDGTFTTNNTSRTITFDFDSIADVLLFDGTLLNIMGGDVDVFQGNTETDEFEIRLVRITD
ncbi:hypothetical protein [Winogradskyella sp. UBA3174]|uniref:hypothetical protein n=1 Tax=Winogradskyella sp. UBA3174 TaxID=1947785 RepID=UPI0025D88581|nr:hypothetical protein [Winogradskyella sp. UBA3174]|tara:strand:- start:16724 stop:17254 length:531 start_codon:yes stop_codon:yes gene_type:complete